MTLTPGSHPWCMIGCVISDNPDPRSMGDGSEGFVTGCQPPAWTARWLWRLLQSYLVSHKNHPPASDTIDSEKVLGVWRWFVIFTDLIPFISGKCIKWKMCYVVSQEWVLNLSGLNCHIGQCNHNNVITYSDKNMFNKTSIFCWKTKTKNWKTLFFDLMIQQRYL